MKLCVQLFARARELAGTDSISMDLPAGSCIADLRDIIADEQERLRPIADSLLFAIGTDYVTDTTIVEAETVACFPPVSGG